MKKARIGKSIANLVTCEICGETPDAEDARKALAKHAASDKCLYCGKPFYKTTFVVEHEVTDGKHKRKWHVSEATAPVKSVSEIKIYPQHKVAFMHPACLKQAFPYWREAAYNDGTPDDLERIKGMADELVARATDAVLARGLHTKAVEDVKRVLHHELAALHKNVVGSSSEFGCPCASRVAATLDGIATKFQQGNKSGI